MAAVLAVCSAVCAAFATGLLVDAVGRLRPGRASVKRDLRVAQRLLAVAELLGHGRAGLRRMTLQPRRRGHLRCCAWSLLLPV